MHIWRVLWRMYISEVFQEEKYPSTYSVISTSHANSARESVAESITTCMINGQTTLSNRGVCSAHYTSWLKQEDRNKGTSGNNLPFPSDDFPPLLFLSVLEKWTISIIEILNSFKINTTNHKIKFNYFHKLLSCHSSLVNILPGPQKNL